ncbi:hypothetical protein; putative Laccase [Frankia alni ACN14a]|uniref:Uncharacterized protein n=1 Tax=Frankia alni (strain DSM 45986 / CECT 9034 / ACN14a) TaxID=326424 RepID=Q0RCU3_FRAAA|nr:hypothetical protein; putative Laccase [Frankia alni ACN14a]
MVVAGPDRGPGVGGVYRLKRFGPTAIFVTRMTHSTEVRWFAPSPDVRVGLHARGRLDGGPTSRWCDVHQWGVRRSAQRVSLSCADMAHSPVGRPPVGLWPVRRSRDRGGFSE